MIQDIQSYRLKKKYSIALRRIVTKDAPSKRMTDLLGISAESFVAFLEALLPSEFTLSNYGRVWVLDHIVPIFLFDQRIEEDLKLCWNYLNIVPMPPLLNRCKGISIDFAIKELDIRGAWTGNHRVISALKQRLARFVESLDRYHSPLKINCLHF